MSVEISGLGANTAVRSSKSAVNGNATDFSNILKKSSETYGIDLDALFATASEKYGVPVTLLKAVAKAESNFNPKATSPVGAMGIMQLMPGTAAGLGVADAYDPGQNIMGGAKYLSELLSRFGGDTTLAVAAYNAGPDAVSKYGGVPPYHETQDYVRTVVGYLGKNITAGTVSGAGIGAVASNTSGLKDNANLGTILESSLLTGGLNSDMTSVLGSLGSSDPKDVSNRLMASVYQLQLQMLQGQGDSDGSSVIV